MNPINVAIYSDYVCPYCYIGADRVRELQAEYDVPVAWNSFELHPEAPAGGIPPNMFYQGDPNLKRISDNARGLAAEAGLQFSKHTSSTQTPGWRWNWESTLNRRGWGTHTARQFSIPIFRISAILEMRWCFWKSLRALASPELARKNVSPSGRWNRLLMSKFRRRGGTVSRAFRPLLSDGIRLSGLNRMRSLSEHSRPQRERVRRSTNEIDARG